MAKDVQMVWASTPSVEARVVALLTKLASVMRQSAWQAASAEGLTPTQADVLQLLAERNTGLRLSALAQLMAVTPATASDAVSSLVLKGLVRKARATEDRRALALVLTATGAATAARLGPSNRFLEEAVARLPGPKRGDLLAGLLALVGQLQTTERFAGLRLCVTCEHFEANRHGPPNPAHHCHLVGAPLPAELLRADCPEHVAAPAEVQQRNWRAACPSV